MADVVLDHIEKLYDNGFRAVKDLSLEIEDSEFLVLVGPSGCGKSTALRMVAGLEDITAGELRVAGRRMNEVAPRDRDIAMVFQSYALYPHLSVGENIGFGLKLRRMPKAEINARVNRAAKMLGLDEILDRRPKQLSGGQRQRVAMGRAIVREPKAFLMDEPLSNLDAKLRVQMRAEIARLQHDMGVTTIYVTHDQIEAMTMGDRVAVMSKGDLMQVGAPQKLYDDPDNLFVGSFIGSPPMNIVEAVVHNGEDEMSVTVGSRKLTIDPELIAARPGLRAYGGRKVAVGVRSEDMSDSSQKPDSPADRRLSTTVLLTEALGSEIVVHFAVDARKVTPDDLLKTGESDSDIFGLEEDVTPFVASFSPRSQVRAGDQVEVAVDTARLHFFDVETGLAIRS
jgi:multiple sugar transport system ATP-binding protein